MPVALIKRWSLFFWGAYFTIVFASNLTDALKALGMVPESFPFVSGNYEFVAKVTSIYDVPGFVNALLFAGVLIWEGLAAWLFWKAFLRYTNDRDARVRNIHSAFAVSLALWGTFILMDELFIAYEVANLEGTHVGLLVASLATLLAVRCLPEEGKDMGEG